MTILNAIRDSPAGQLVRLLRPELLPYPEEQDFPQKDLYKDAELIAEKSEPSSTPSEATITPHSDDERRHTDIEAGIPEKFEENHEASPTIREDGTIICDWYSASDSDNPENWSSRKKLWVVACICYCSFVVYMSAPV